MVVFKSHNPSHLLRIVIILSLFLCISLSAQTPSTKKNISLSFDSAHVEYTEMAVISNVLRIKNNQNKNYTIQISISCPSGWRTLTNSQKKYTLAAKDSLVVPVRLLTSNKKTKGGAKYNINALVSIKETGQVVSASFFAGRPKITKMKMDVLPGSKIYFLNNETSASFKIRFTNDGDEDQNIILSMNKIGKDFMVTDTNGSFFKKNYLELPVKPFSDSLISLGVKLLKDVPNQKRIDTYSYTYNSAEQKKQNTIFLRASEPGANKGKRSSNTGAEVIKMAKSIDFVKLGNSAKLNTIDNNSLPLSMQLNFSNIFNNQPVMNLILNGIKDMGDQSYLSYFYQNTFNYYLLDKTKYSNGFWQVGYFHNKGSIQIGSGVQLNMAQVRAVGSQGKGIAGTYNLSRDHKVGAFLSFKPSGDNSLKGLNYGIGYSGKYNKMHFGFGYSHANMNNEYSADMISAGSNFPIGKFQHLNISASINRYTLAFEKRQGFNGSINYGVTYLKQRASSTIRFLYNQIPNALTGNSLSKRNTPIITIGLSNTFKLSANYGLSSEHYYTSNPVFDFNTKQNLNNTYFNNFMNVTSSKRKKVAYTPGVYMTYSDYFNQKLLSEGLQLNINSSEIDQNFRLGLSLKGGFNKLLNHPELGTFFTAQTNSFLSYRTFNFNVRYFYGPQSQTNIIQALTVQKKYNQNLYLTLGHQHQFQNKHFIVENNLTYNYLNINQRQTIGLFTQIYYYTTQGWRFSLNMNYNYTIAESFKYTYDPNSAGSYNMEANTSKQKAKNIQFGIGIKKDFSLALPKKIAGSHYSLVPVKAFLDMNGNRLFDKEEAALENVVIQLNDFEVQTNENGEAKFENAAFGKYKLKAFSLVELGAWFPVVDDSIDITSDAIQFIPFSKGVQVLGNVEINREKFSGAMNQKLDVSRLKVFLLDSTGKMMTTVTDNQGNFKFYSPNGKYTLRFDERMLGDAFELMQNDIELDLNSGMDSYYHTFFIVEKRRKVKTKKFGSDGKVIEGQEATPIENLNTEENTPKKK